MGKAILVLLVFAIFQNTYAQSDTLTSKSIDNYFQEVRAYRNQNKITLALQSLEKAVILAEEKENEKALVNCYHKFSLLNLDLDKKDKAIFYWDRAAALLKELEFPYGSAFHKYIEALLLYREGQNFQALYILNEPKNISNDRNLRHKILLIEGYIYLNIEKFENASKNFNSIVVNKDIYEQKYLATQAYIGLAKLNYATENWAESIKNSLNALKIANNNLFYKEVIETNELLGTTYEKMGQLDASLLHHRNLLRIKDSVFTISKLETEVKTADRIQFERMNKKIKNQEKEIEELSKSVNRSEITAILTSAFLTIISLLAVSLYRNNQIKLKTNDLLQTKNKELQSARDEAVSAMEAKTNFLSTVSHELRTPLYAVTGLTHLLLEEDPADHQKEHLKSLKFSGDYLLNFINDILQINKIDADKLETLNIQFNLKKVLQEVIDSLHQSAKENKTEIVLDHDETIPLHLMGDPLKLSQIFINLVGNAIKFTKEGKVTVITRLSKKNEHDLSLYFEVKDNGIGISEEMQQGIFDSFEQGSIQINREYGGTGLGLTIVKSLLGLFGSKIQLKSTLGEGSSFFFQLNVKSKDDVIDDTPFQIAPEVYELEGLHLLVVEDNKINQVITKKMLNKKDITCDIASNGTLAVEMAQKNTYNGILMDIHMPGISGEEATIRIRKFDKEIPIIALTAISLDDSLESFYAAGCNDVVTKPFKPELFYQKIGENIFNPKHKKTTT